MPPLQVVEQPQPYGEQGVRFSLDEVARRAAKGGLDARVRAWAIEQLERARREQGIRADNDRERATVLLKSVQKKLWVPDPVGAEWMAGAHLLACDVSSPDAICMHGSDCFTEGTLLLREGHELVPVEQIKPGQKIWGLNQWSTVEAVEYKGTLSIDVVQLNNGSELKLTGDHHVYVLDCREHPMLDEQEDAKALPPDRHWRATDTTKPKNGNGCTCGKEDRSEKRARISELRRGMVLISPDRIPFGSEEMDPDVAYVEGLFVSDGWTSAKGRNKTNSDFCISGQDGCPKEEQKREVQAICDRLGIPTYWSRKYIAVQDKEWALRCQRMGKYAPQKHLLSINLSEGCAGPYLRGVMADSGANSSGVGRTFTTTSRLLAVQTRLLHKMFGVACGWSYIENHGGLGENPIWRLGTRENARVDGRRPWLLRVREVIRNVAEAPCWDIQTDDHRVYLPEHDVTVSQCDDLSILLGACLLGVGIYVAVVGHAYNGSSSIGHVLLAAWVDGQWEYADPSTDLALGKCVKFSRERLISVPNVKVICDSNVCLRERTDYHPEKNDFVVKGVFVGVDGPPLSPPKFFWNANASVLGVENSNERLKKCLDAASNANLDTAAGREAAAKQAARCAADGYCATYGVPPGVCSSVVGPIADAVVDAFSDLFGGDPKTDCNKVSTFDPCHVCNALKVGRLDYHNWVKQDPKCKAWMAAAPARLTDKVNKAALDALVTRYENAWAWALTIKSGKPNFAALQKDPALLESTKKALVAQGARQLTLDELERARRGDTSVTPAISQAIQSVDNTAPGKSKPSSSLMPVLAVSAVGAGLWWWLK